MHALADLPRLSPLAPPLPAAGAMLEWRRLPGCAKALALAQAARAHPAPIVVIESDSLAVERLVSELAFFLGDDPALPVRTFPDWETLPYELFSPYQDIISERLATLAALPGMGAGLLVVAAGPALHRLPPRSFVSAHSFDLAVGTRLGREAFQARLEQAGYRRVGQVMEHGDYALRGALVDVFPMGAQTPFRVDLFDDDIEAIRLFDPESQRSLESVPRLRILPAREFPLDDAAVALFRGNWRERFPGNAGRCPIYNDVSNRLAPAGIEYYLPLFFAATATLFDYLPPAALLVVDEGALAEAAQFREQATARWERLRHDLERPVLPPDDLFHDADWLAQAARRHACITVTGPGGGTPGARVCEFAAEAPLALPIDARAKEPLLPVTRYLAETSQRVLFVAETPGRRETLIDLFRGAGISPASADDWAGFLAGDAPVVLTVAPMERGLRLTDPHIAIVTEAQLFGERAAQRRRRRAAGRDAEGLIRNLTELTIGSPVVHEDHGVGRYRGLVTLTVNGVDGEFLHLEYADGDKLYVPVASLDLIGRYAGLDPEQAPLHKLGAKDWLKAREKAAARARDVAAELLDVYARRAARQGHRFRLDQNAYRAFTSAFPFEETPDQEAAIEAVLADMQSSRPMDRLVCGDAGFGKTEVAMRAAFVAAMDGRQVAVLVPTTLLAQQHYQTFRDRFADWPVRIEQISRFRNRKEQADTLGGVADGRVDIIIGTHKLLGEGLKFANLGLLVIDEEHRFGVRQKEQLKSLRADVDILTLTATPIPRTLNLALSSVRELSLIATPPSRRLPVKTFVRQWDDELLREAMLREVNRGGQVYFLHNEVETIEKTAATVAALLPQARVQFAHGQMRERDLERVMLDFYHRRFNVLVCSTIIETGIDVPSANTIIINRADRFGLAQLYQLRGRVGRSHHRAYAYLIVPDRRSMTADAVKRLEAVESLEDLGIGFTLATHDLEIRGAGEILGDEQSGHIHAIGYALYMEIIERAVRALKSGREPALEKPLAHGPDVELMLPALIPDDYLPDVHARLVFYKRISASGTPEDLQDLTEEMIDRFGDLPPQARNLFRIAGIRHAAARLGIRRIDLGVEGGRLHFDPEPRIDPAAVIRLIQTDAKHYRLDGRDKLRIRRDMVDAESRFAEAERLLALLAPQDA